MSATTDIWNVKELLQIVGTQLLFFLNALKIYSKFFFINNYSVPFRGLITLFMDCFWRLFAFDFEGLEMGWITWLCSDCPKLGLSLIRNLCIFHTPTLIMFFIYEFFFRIFKIFYNIVLLCDICCNKFAIDCNWIPVVCVSHSFTKRYRMSFSFTMDNLHFII